MLAAMLAVAAASAAGGAFPCDPGCAGNTPTAKVHFLAGYVSVPAIVLAPFLSWAAMRGRPAWRGYEAFSLAAGILLVGASGWLVAGYYAGCGQWWWPVGVAQRVTLGVQYGWMVVVAGRLWVLAGRSSPAGDDTVGERVAGSAPRGDVLNGSPRPLWLAGFLCAPARAVDLPYGTHGTGFKLPPEQSCDADLDIVAWPQLSATVKAGILPIIESATR